MAAEQPTIQPPLTPAGIEKLPRGEYRDTAAPGLFLRINIHSRTFRWYVRSLRRAVTIGRWAKSPCPGHVTLGQAREWLERLKEAHRAGRLGQVVKELEALHPRRGAVLPTPALAGAITVRAAAKEFLAHLELRRRRPEQAQRIFDVEILPLLGDRPIEEIRKSDITDLLEGIAKRVRHGEHGSVVKRGSPVMAAQARALLKQFFSWAADKDRIQSSPGFPRLDTIGASKAARRDRVLDPEEIAAFWRELGTFKGFTPTVRNGLRLLLLLGVRSGELRQATWEEFDLDAGVWVIPPEHQKKPHGPWKIPLPGMAVELLRELKALSKAFSSQYVLASFANKGEALTEKALNHAMRRLFSGKEPVLVFSGRRPVPHDLRRTLRYHARQTLRVPFDVSEKLLGHSLGVIPGTYDPGDLYEERRAALEKWAAYVERLVSPRTAKVALIAGRGGTP